MDNVLYEIAMMKTRNLREALIKRVNGKVWIYYHTDCNVLEVSIITNELGHWRKLFTNVDQLEVPDLELTVVQNYRSYITSKFLKA